MKIGLFDRNDRVILAWIAFAAFAAVGLLLSMIGAVSVIVWMTG